MVDVVKNSRMWKKYNTKLPIRESAAASFLLLIVAITGVLLCKVGSVSCDLASSACASGRYLHPADAAQKCSAPQGWRAFL